MGSGLFYALDYGAVFLGLAALWAVLVLAAGYVTGARLVWRVVGAAPVVMAMAVVPIWLEGRDRQADFDDMSRYEVTALPADLPPGRVLWLESDVAPAAIFAPN